MDEVLIEPTFGTALAHGQAAAFSRPPGVSFATRPCVKFNSCGMGAQERWKPCQVYSFLSLDKSNFVSENKASSFNSFAIFTDRFGVWPTKYRLVNVHAFGGIFPLRINLICNEFRKGNEKMACTWLFQVGKCNLGVLWYLYSLQNLLKILKQNNTK